MWQELTANTRYAIVAIEATMDYLTAHDEESEEDGWEEVETQFADYLSGFNPYRDKSVPTARFIEWEKADA